MARDLHALNTAESRDFRALQKTLRKSLNSGPWPDRLHGRNWQVIEVTGTTKTGNKFPGRLTWKQEDGTVTTGQDVLIVPHGTTVRNGDLMIGLQNGYSGGKAVFWCVAGSGGDGSFWLKHTARGFAPGGLYVYAWTEQIPTKGGRWSDGPRTGTLGAYVTISSVPPVWTVTVNGASSGTFTLTVDGVETAAIAYDASTSDIADALIAAGANLTGDGSITFADSDPHTIVWTSNRLKPDSVGPAFDVNDKDMNPLNTRERLWLGFKASPQVLTTKTTTGNGSVSTVWTVDVLEAAHGTYTLTWFDSDGTEHTTAAIEWDAAAATIQAALDAAAGAGVR
jgi:hypothetical protein